MSSYVNRQELADKIDYEGGTYDMLFGYGLGADDLPQNDAELLSAFAAIDALRGAFQSAVDAFEALLPGPESDQPYHDFYPNLR
jgi:hypothetical protein